MAISIVEKLYAPNDDRAVHNAAHLNGSTINKSWSHASKRRISTAMLLKQKDKRFEYWSSEMSARKDA